MRLHEQDRSVLAICDHNKYLTLLERYLLNQLLGTQDLRLKSRNTYCLSLNEHTKCKSYIYITFFHIFIIASFLKAETTLFHTLQYNTR